MIDCSHCGYRRPDVNGVPAATMQDAEAFAKLARGVYAALALTCRGCGAEFPALVARPYTVEIAQLVEQAEAARG